MFNIREELYRTHFYVYIQGIGHGWYLSDKEWEPSPFHPSFLPRPFSAKRTIPSPHPAVLARRTGEYNSVFAWENVKSRLVSPSSYLTVISRVSKEIGP